MLLARAFFDEQEDWVWAILGKLNRMRNLMAHTLEPATMEYEKCRNSIYSVIGDRCGKNCEDLRPKLIEIFEYVLGFLSCFCLARIEILRLTTAISVMNSPAVDMEKLRIPMPEDAK
jgi:hypothetical protein